MFTLIISTLFAIATLLALALPNVLSWIWSGIIAILAFFICNFLIGRHLKNKVEGLMMQIQSIMMSGQKQMQAKMNTWKTRPPGSLKQAQIEMQKMQNACIVKALDATNIFEPYYKWVPLLKKQINTLRMQLYYQKRDWSEVDKLMPNCIFLEPVTYAMKIARMYMRKEDGIDKIFAKSVAKLRYGQGAVLYGLYAWIQLQQGNTDGALATTLEATRKLENETLKNNLTLLQNGKSKQFNLAGLGEEWYALGLEEPRVKYQRQHERIY